MLAVEQTHQLSILNKKESLLVQDDVEPFIEIPDFTSPEPARSAFRFGYRSALTGATLAAVEIPAVLVANSMPLRVSARMTLDGTIVTHAEMPDHRHEMTNGGLNEVPLVELIEEALNVDNLRMEQASADELNSLVQELESFIQRIKARLTTL